MTQISVNIPDDVMQQMRQTWQNIPQRALEALAIEAYRGGILTSAEVQHMLSLSSRWEVDALLKSAQAYFEYSEGDLEHDIRTLETLLEAS